MVVLPVLSVPMTAFPEAAGTVDAVLNGTFFCPHPVAIRRTKSVSAATCCCFMSLLPLRPLRCGKYGPRWQAREHGLGSRRACNDFRVLGSASALHDFQIRAEDQSRFGGRLHVVGIQSGRDLLEH